jgi:hypothetical protein
VELLSSNWLYLCMGVLCCTALVLRALEADVTPPRGTVGSGGAASLRGLSATIHFARRDAAAPLIASFFEFEELAHLT